MSNIRDMESLKNTLSRISKESPTYEKLAYYIDRNFMRIVFMTAGEVASETNISQGSVSRFCTALGFRGYNDFLRSLQQLVSEEITAPQRLQFTSQNSNSDKIANILNMEHKNIDELPNIINTTAYKRLADDIVAAEEIVLLSARMSATLVPYTAYLLNKIRGGVSVVSPQTQEWDTLGIRDKEKTLVFSIVFPRYPRVLVNKLTELHETGFKTAAITDSLIAPVYGICDNVLQIPITVSSIFDVYSTPMLFLNLLMRDVAKGSSGLGCRLDRLEAIDERNDVYYKKQ